MSFNQFFQMLALKLYEAAEEGGYVDPEKISTILGISRAETRSVDNEALRK